MPPFKPVLFIGIDLVPESAVILQVFGIGLRAVAGSHVAGRLCNHQDITIRGRIFLPLGLAAAIGIGISSSSEIRPPRNKLVGQVLLRRVKRMRRSRPPRHNHFVGTP
jgi:hypothetical protein